MQIEVKIKDKIFSFSEDKIPRHVAIIMDGNGRWAKKRFMPRLVGHRNGVMAIKAIVKTAVKLKQLKYLTLYAFSTENWRRPAEEVSGLMKLLVEFLRKEVRELAEQGVRLLHIGDISKLPAFAHKELLWAEKETANGKELNLVLALNYSGRDEIIRACNKILQSQSDEPITENEFITYLDTAQIPDPDLLIRTSGEIRISNFLLWQLAYSEFYFTDVLWPDFSPRHFLEAIAEYGKRERRFGGI